MTTEEAINKIEEGTSLSDIDPKFRKDRDVVMVAVTENGGELEFASDELKKDKEIALAAIKSHGGMPLHFIADELWDDEDFVFKATEEFESSFLYASERLKDDRKFVMNALELLNISIETISDKLQDDSEIVIMAIQNNPMEIQFASDRLKSDASFILMALEISPEIIQYANNNLFDEEDFVIKCLEKEPRSHKFNPSLNNYHIFVNSSSDPFDTNHIKDYHKVIAVMHGYYYEDFIDPLDENIILEAMKRGASIDPSWLQNIAFSNLGDGELIIKLLKGQGLLLKHLSEYQNDIEAVHAAVSNNGLAYKYASPELRKYLQISKEAVLNNPAAIDYISKEVKSNQEFLDFIKQHFSVDFIKQHFSADFIKQQFQNGI